MVFYFRLSILLLALTSAAELAAQDIELKGTQDPARQVHWAMGAYFGSGWYQVDSNRSMYILRIPTRQTLSASSIDGQGEREFGIEILYPLTFGLHTLDELPDFIDFDNFATVSFTPGIQVEIPVTQKWSLRPYAHFGWGTETNTSDTAWIYYGGIKSRYRLGDGSNNWSLLNGLYYAGYQPEFKSRGKFASFMTGMEYSLPLSGIDLGGDDLWLNTHITYNYFFDKLNFHVDEDRVESISDQWELGLALGKGNKKIKIWFISFEHIGLSYKWSSNRHYRAIAVNVRSPFTF
ncbi:MAG: hypothetical protein IMF09_00525 [Proteobacteria bacterium]|nr:hypothetical protein [Pseudomonadota bacterium]